MKGSGVAFCMALAVLGGFLYPLPAPAQNQQAPIAVSLEAAFPTPLRPGSQGTLTARIRNVLTPRQPLELYAEAPYEVTGQTTTVRSNTVTIRVVQPVDVKLINFALPAGLSPASSTITFPIPLNVSLMEGEEYQIQIPVVAR